ncbi:AraC family transcriptional regulator [Mesorhizobium sp.]|uniref:AraC family transcriptional regulator n=1 Tax=Mesorhizobium sp. TaxID=1871066 RepID=UPI0025FDF0AA|nr:AraC family transcriptional regulator [Mesorhizobium sp.]
MNPSPKDKIYSVAKIAVIVDLLAEEGVPAEQALADVSLLPEQLRSPATKVCAAQVLQCYRNAIKFSGDPQFAYHAGSRFRVSTYGMYGFAILSSPSFRETMAFATAYHQLATPLVEIGFRQEPGAGAWVVSPAPYLEIDDLLYKFIVELQMAVHLSLHRNIMGAAFRPEQVDYAFGRPHGDKGGAAFLDCPVLYGKPENRLAFDGGWLDKRPDFGNELAFAELKQLCAGLLKGLELNAGVAGKVRELILSNLSRPISFEQVAKSLNMSERSLRRRLQEEGTSFRDLADELRVQVAIRYVRDTDLSVEDIAFALGFSDASAFRHAFRRWTNAAPHEYRRARVDTKREPPAGPDR